MLEAARSQIAGTVSQAEVRNLPLNGRNFLDLALLVPGVSPTNVGEHAALRRDVGGARPGHLRRQPAQLLQQLHRRRPVRQRRCGRPERHPVRRRRGGSVPGGDVGRPGGAGPRARRLHQRGHQERHQHAARRPLRLLPRRRASTRANALSGTQAADDAAAVRRQPRRADRPRPDVLLRERRAARPGSDRPGHRSPHGERRRDQRAAGRGRLPGRAGRDRASIPIRCTRTNFLGKVDHQFSAQRSASASATACTTSTSSNSRGAGGTERAERVVAASTTSIRPSPFSNIADAVAADGQRDARPVRPQRSARRRRPIRSGRRSALPASPRSARSRAVPPAASTRCTRSSTTCRTRRARTRCARASTSSTTTTRSPIPRSIRGSYAFSSLANFLAGVYNNAGFTQTFGDDRGLADESERRRSTRRTSGRSARGLTLNAGLRYDLQFLETIDTDTQQRLAAARRSPGRRWRRGGRWCAAAPGSSTTACRCARSPTRCCRPATRPTSTNLRQISVSLSPTQAGAPVFPEHPAAASCPSVTLVNFTTMDREHAERLLAAGQRRDRAAARRARAPSASATSTCAGCT